MDSHKDLDDILRNPHRLSTQSFKQDPSKLGPSKLSSLQSFAIFGLDVKITPEEQSQVIEVNGLTSGMDGFLMAYIEDKATLDLLQDLYRFKYGFGWTYDEETMEKLWEISEQVRLGKIFSHEQTLLDHLNGLGVAPLAYIDGRLRLSSIHARYLFGGNLVMGIWNDSLSSNNGNAIHKGWERKFGGIADLLIAFEDILNHKKRTDALFNPIREIKPKSFHLTKLGLQALVDLYHPPLIVIKPCKGKRGVDVSILRPELALKQLAIYHRNMLAEPFIPSKPVYSGRDNQYHDGCMRYVVVMERKKSGEIDLFHVGGYWRLCRLGINFEHEDSRRANLCNGAIPERASDQDLSLVKSLVDSYFPTFYRNLEKVAYKDLKANEAKLRIPIPK